MALPPTPTPTTASATGVGQQTGTESALSNWAGPYVTNMLGKGQALANMPYEAYTGPLTAGPSNLQTQAFQGIAGLTVPGAVTDAASSVGQLSSQMAAAAKYSPTSFNSTFTTPGTYAPTDITTGKFIDEGVSQQYMNPYLRLALDPQIAEAKRQSEIQNLQNRTALTRAGAYGGGRGALMESEAQRNLQANLANITGQGYNTAYQQAQQAFTTDQARALQAAQAAEQSKQFGYGQQMTAADLNARYALEAQRAAEQSRQFGTQYGLQGLQAAAQAAVSQGQLGALQNQIQSQNLQSQLGAGAVQRGITQEGIAADLAQFKEEQQYPYKQVQYQQSLLQGLPLATQAYSYSEPSALANMAGSAEGLRQLFDLIDKKAA